jgi:hypothetical protein
VQERPDGCSKRGFSNLYTIFIALFLPNQPDMKKKGKKINETTAGRNSGEPDQAGSCHLPGRRKFLASMGLAGGGAVAMASGAQALTLERELFNWSTQKAMSPPLLPGDSDDKPLIRVAFSRGRDEYYMGWPGAAFGHRESQARYTEILEHAATRHRINLDISHEPLRNTEHAESYLQETLAMEADGAIIIVMNLNDGWPMAEQFVRGKGKLPSIIFSPMGTQFTPHLRPFRETPNCFAASTENLDWLDTALNMLKTVWQLDNTRIAAIGPGQEREEKLNPTGITIRYISHDWFLDAYNATGKSAEAEAIARRFMENARSVAEPSREDVLQAARTYIANRRVMDESGCHAVTMDCLGLVTTKSAPPPCMAYMQLLNEGTCGCCERDITAAMSLMLSSYLFHRPGFMHNPTPSTVTNNYGGAHCTAPTLMDGFTGGHTGYILRNHHESDWGVAPQVLLREKQPATIMKFLNAGTLFAASGKILSNIDQKPGDGIGGCRTSFTMAMDDVRDVRDMRGHHSLLVYGNHINLLRAWGQLNGVAIEHICGGPL